MCKGEVSIISYPDKGKEIVYNILKTDEIFGNNLIFSSNPYYKGDIIADCESLIGLLGKQDLIAILQNVYDSRSKSNDEGSREYILCTSYEFL